MLFIPFNSFSLSCQYLPRAGSGVVRIDPLHFMAGCRKRRLNQVLSVLYLIMIFIVLFITVPFYVLLVFVGMCSVLVVLVKLSVLVK